ncbi:hypothetical protein AK812_SmicGene14839 [Symbiodinium microadriaticum]|uniref:Uncharacterized protein n=1 Tax=Symbiodinium microadriaticum TaxID=2951 RepID=A0A1Q9E4J9_SYMMI|nr:hypothetical protein AK812_SmicGene14839 [Symbiodinium microadriaticum]
MYIRVLQLPHCNRLRRKSAQKKELGRLFDQLVRATFERRRFDGNSNTSTTNMKRPGLSRILEATNQLEPAASRLGPGTKVGSRTFSGSQRDVVELKELQLALAAVSDCDGRSGTGSVASRRTAYCEDVAWRYAFSKLQCGDSVSGLEIRQKDAEYMGLKRSLGQEQSVAHQRTSTANVEKVEVMLAMHFY